MHSKKNHDEDKNSQTYDDGDSAKQKRGNPQQKYSMEPRIEERKQTEN